MIYLYFNYYMCKKLEVIYRRIISTINVDASANKFRACRFKWWGSLHSYSKRFLCISSLTMGMLKFLRISSFYINLCMALVIVRRCNISSHLCFTDCCFACASSQKDSIRIAKLVWKYRGKWVFYFPASILSVG